MSRKSHTLSLVDTDFIDRSKVFIEATSPTWRTPMKISVEDLFDPNYTRQHQNTRTDEYNIADDIDHDTLTIDPCTFKVKVNFPHIDAPCVFCEPFNDHNISYYQPPLSSSGVSSMHLMTDGNYLYIWVGNRWKRTVLSEWD